jgi:hypothetical protein
MIEPAGDHRHAPRKRKTRDTLTEAGARELAAEIANYWHSRGEPTVATWTAQFYALLNSGKRDHLDRRFAVRSNLVGGLPPK